MIDYYMDDLFIFLPSTLTEGKSIGSADIRDLTVMKKMVQNQYKNAQTFAKIRKAGADTGRKVLAKAKKETKQALTQIFGIYDFDSSNPEHFKKTAQTIMREAWRTVYLAGLRAGGIPGSGKGPAGELVNIEKGPESKWLKGAMQHEMRFFNKFLAAVIAGTTKMPIHKRIDMYVDALTSFYDSARVIGLPDTVLIYWAGPNDKVTCVSCEYMFKNSPFTKLTLPTVPRSGMTACLTNCRDRLMIRQASQKRVREVETEGKTRARYLAALRKIKKNPPKTSLKKK